jgi:hypothetical protein
MNKTDIEAGLDQMGFEMVDNGIMQLPASSPATYNFVGKAEYNPDAFEEALEDKGFSHLTANTDTREDGEFYYYVDVVTDHYKKVKVKVWADSACIFPKEEQPDTFEFARIVRAIEDAFGELEHDPQTEND